MFYRTSSEKTPVTAKTGPVIGGIQRRPRGLWFVLFCWPFQSRFAPAPAAATRLQRFAHYVALPFSLGRRWGVIGVMWQVRWAVTAALLLLGALYLFFTAWALVALVTGLPMPQVKG